MHSRSRMTIDPSIPTAPGRNTAGFHQPGRHRVHQAGVYDCDTMIAVFPAKFEQNTDSARECAKGGATWRARRGKSAPFRTLLSVLQCPET